MLATQAYAIDTEDQAKVLTVKFYYSIPTNGLTSTGVSGTSTNNLAWAVYDVTNSSWLTSAGNFNIIQSNGVGYCTGTVQTNSTTASLRFVLYFPTATTSATTFNLDGFYLGPQTAPMGPAMTDWVAYTPTFTGFGTPTNVNFYSRVVGDSLEVNGRFTAGTTTGVQAQITLGYNGGNANVVIDSNKTVNTYSGIMNTNTPVSTTIFNWGVIAQTGQSYVCFGEQSSTTAITTALINGNTITTGAVVSVNFKVPIVGWSSNTSMSSDTDTRVVAMQVQQASPTATVTSSYSLLKFTSGVLNDTHGGFNTSTGLYTVPVSGYYRCTASVSVSATYAINNFTAIAVSKNSSFTNMAEGLQYAGGAETVLAAISSFTILCNAGDTLSPAVISSGTSPTIVANIQTNYFSVERLSGPAVVAATESVNARYTLVGATAFPNNAVTNLSSTYATYTKVRDSHNAFNTSTGVYTIPVTGTYRVSLRFGIQPSSATTGAIQVGATQAGSATTASFGSVSFGATTAIQAPQMSDNFYCLAGDTIQLSGYQSNGSAIAISSTASINGFSIERVGN